MTKESVTTNSKGLRNELNLQDPDKIDLPSEQNKEIETLKQTHAPSELAFAAFVFLIISLCVDKQ